MCVELLVSPARLKPLSSDTSVHSYTAGSAIMKTKQKGILRLEGSLVICAIRTIQYWYTVIMACCEDDVSVLS